ncbi:MAG: membrane protein insertase YidC [Phycisphaerae bacterium]
MESRRLITAIMLALLFWIVLQQFSAKFWPAPPKTEVPATTSGPTTQEASTQMARTPKTQPASTQAVFLDQDKSRNDNITIGNSVKGNGYKMRTTFSNFGASLKTAQLSDYAESVSDAKQGYRLISPVEYPSGERYSLSTEKLILMDDKGNELFTVGLDDTKWFYKVAHNADGQQVRFWIDIDRKGQKLMRVGKTFELKKGTLDLKFNIELENLSGENLKAVIRQEGLVGIRKEDPRSEDRKVYAGLRRSGRDGIQATSALRSDLLKLADQMRRMGAVDEQAVWAGQTNKYFAALMAAVDDQGKISGKLIDYVDAKTYSSEPDLGVPDLGKDLSTIWVSKPISVGPQKKADMNFDLYLGPKSHTFFSQGKYLERNYSLTFDSSWCTMQWLADFMAWLLNKLFLVTRNYGIAIILLVVIVRVVLHPVSKSSQVNMMRSQRQMQKLHPKISALKEKYKNNKEGLNKATMELYKAEGVNPAGQILGCLPMMLQMPIWIALWTALNNTFELRHQPFFFWIRDLAGSDALIHFSQSYKIPLLSGMIGDVQDLNVLPVLVLLAFIVQQVFSPQTAPNPDADPSQAKQQKFMMYFMSIFMGLIFYNAPSGLNLYILTSSLLGVVENKRIRQHLEDEQNRPPDPKKKNGSWFDKIQKKMEQLAQQWEDQKTAKK